jgi:hypothetical protein
MEMYMNAATVSRDKRRGNATGEIAVMGKEGDSKHYWNVKNWDEVRLAKEVFDKYVGAKFKPYNMNSKGDKGEPMSEFDPSAGSILFIPAMQGG